MKNPVWVEKLRPGPWHLRCEGCNLDEVVGSYEDAGAAWVAHILSVHPDEMVEE